MACLICRGCCCFTRKWKVGPKMVDTRTNIREIKMSLLLPPWEKQCEMTAKLAFHPDRQMSVQDSFANMKKFVGILQTLTTQARAEVDGRTSRSKMVQLGSF